MDTKRVRELIGYLVSMAVVYNEEDAKMVRKFAEELDKLLPEISHHDVNEFYSDNE